MWLFAVHGKTRPDMSEQFAQAWQRVYSRRFPDMAAFVQATFSADREANTWLAVSLWSARPDEEQLRPATQELGEQVGSLLAGPPTAEWLEVLRQI